MIAKTLAMFALALPAFAGELPLGYTLLDYVEAAGNQPVITEYVPKGNTSIKARLALTKMDSSHTIFCARGTTTAVRTFTMFWIVAWSHDATGLRWDYGSENAYREVWDPADISEGTPFDLNIRGNDVYVNDKRLSISHNQAEDYQADNALVLFAAYSAEPGSLQKTTTFSSCGHVRLYSLTAKEGNDVVLNLIPCLNPNSVAGLYDTVSGSFLSSCNSDSPLTPSGEAATLTIEMDREGALCQHGVGTFTIPAAEPMMICAESSVDSSLAAITPIGWELSVTPVEGDPYKVVSEGTNACCCTYTAQQGDELSLKWHCARTEGNEKLPAGYTRLECVKATGSQALLTDYTPTGKTGVDLVMRIDTTTDQMVFCARGADFQKNTFTLYLTKGALRWDYGASNAVVNTTDAKNLDKERVKVSIRGNAFFIGSELSKISKPTSVDYTADNRLVLFASYLTDRPQEPTGFSSFAKMDLFLFRVLEDGLLVRQYLPCRRDGDGAVGLYETITGTFLQSSGDPLVAEELRPDTRKFIDDRAKDGETELPAGYAAVEFVEATGSQYVVTKYTPNGNSEFSAKLDILEEANAGIFCARGADNVDPYALWYIVNVRVSGIRWDYSTTDGNAVTPEPPGAYELQGLRNEFYINGRKDATISKSKPAEFTARNRLVLFASYATSSPAEPTGFSYPAKVRLYSFAVAEGDALTMNLLPCLRMSDGVAGLYDAVGKEFYSSSSGTALSAPEIEPKMLVVGKGGELGEATLPYGVSSGVKAGDSFICSVPKKVETSRGVLSCLGYLLETNGFGGGVWIPWKSGKANSFVYEHPANADARLTWTWGKPGLAIVVY